jgi:hypothetical protein
MNPRAFLGLLLYNIGKGGNKLNSNNSVNSNDVYGRVILVNSSGEKTNAYTYYKMKNKITYGSRQSSLLNKGKKKVVR